MTNNKTAYNIVQAQPYRVCAYSHLNTPLNTPVKPTNQKKFAQLK